MLSSCGIGYYSTTVIEPIPSPRPTTTIINISLQPSWGPAGYDYAMFYYFPEFNFYYDVERAMFHYLNYGRWVSAKMLPRGRHFPADLHRYYKVVINQRNPWTYNRQHKRQYKHYKGVYNQRTLRDVGGVMMPQSNPRIDTPRRIHNPNSTPSRNNNTTLTPQNNTNRGQGSRSNIVQGGQKNSQQRGNTNQNNSKSQSSRSTGSRSTGSRGR